MGWANATQLMEGVTTLLGSSHEQGNTAARLASLTRTCLTTCVMCTQSIMDILVFMQRPNQCPTLKDGVILVRVGVHFVIQHIPHKFRTNVFGTIFNFYLSHSNLIPTIPKRHVMTFPDSGRRRVLSVTKCPDLPANEWLCSDPTDLISCDSQKWLRLLWGAFRYYIHTHQETCISKLRRDRSAGISPRMARCAPLAFSRDATKLAESRRLGRRARLEPSIPVPSSWISLLGGWGWVRPRICSKVSSERFRVRA